ncbi:MAG: pilus (MSHA type) biogenesis protein MshL [Vibrionaceae bacterium]
MALAVSAGLTACTVGHRDPVEVKQALNEAHNQSVSRNLAVLPDAVTQDLTSSFVAQARPVANEKRIRVNAKGVDARDFFGALVQNTPYDLMLHPGVSGRITLSLKEATLPEILEAAADLYGYGISFKGNVLQVLPATLRTQTFPVDYLQLQRAGLSQTSVNINGLTERKGGGRAISSALGKGAAGNGTSIETRTYSDFWAQLERSVTTMIGAGDGKNVSVSPQASLLTVTAYPHELRQVKEFLAVSQQRLKRQVILEAKILEVTLHDGYQQGINWSNITKTVGSTVTNISRPGAALAGNAVSNLAGGPTNITITDGDFQGVLSFLDTQGDVNVLSSPRVTAANNQKAVIKVGGDEFFVTDISFSNVVGDNNTNSGGPNIELTPFFSGISLNITPQIDNNNGIMLHVQPSVVDVTSEEKSIQLGQSDKPFVLPLAKTSVRESDSIIHAQSGDVVVIGGLMTSRYRDAVSKVPLLGDVPVVGHLFRNVVREQQKSELVILIQPRVVGSQTMQQEIERSRALLGSDWFAG